LGERNVQNVIVHETQQRKTPPIAQTIMYLQYGCDFILCFDGAEVLVPPW
jgi:hypothetical protein